MIIKIHSESIYLMSKQHSFSLERSKSLITYFQQYASYFVMIDHLFIKNII